MQLLSFSGVLSVSVLALFSKVVCGGGIICAHELAADVVPILTSSIPLAQGETAATSPVPRLENKVIATGTDARSAREVQGMGRFLSFLLGIAEADIDLSAFRLNLGSQGGWDLRGVENFAVSPDKTRVAFSQWGSGTAPFYLFDSTLSKVLSASVEFDEQIAADAYEQIGVQFNLPEGLTTGGTEGVVSRMERVANGTRGIFPYRNMSFSPDGKKLVVDAGTMFTVFNAETLKPLYQFSAGLPVNGAAWFIGEGDYILSVHELGLEGGNANVAMIWAADEPKLLRIQTIDKGLIPPVLGAYGGTGSNLAGRGITPADSKGRYWVRSVQLPPNYGPIIAAAERGSISRDQSAELIRQAMDPPPRRV